MVRTSREYDLYLERHRKNVRNAYEWLRKNLPHLFEGVPDSSWQIIFDHDSSKDREDEYKPYDDYFYGQNKSFAVVETYKKAWLLHLHRNPHHWQYWILINDDAKEGEIILPMPYNYIIEMICDWWSFSWQKGDLTEIFSWYDERSMYMKLAPETRKTVEHILWEIRGRLGYNTLAHHGIKGQKWGVKNGPPYPIKESSEQSSYKQKEDRGFKNIVISKNKFINYALDTKKAPDKAYAFEAALGYNKNNYERLIEDIQKHIDLDKMVEKGDNGYGMRYEQIIKLKGTNGKEANVLTAWIRDKEDLRLTSVYITKKEETK